MQIELLRRKLLAWSREQKRSLPWRGTTDPYRVWVSEVMLQQTTVAAVRERYGPFLERFPDLASLARAREERVLAAWSGLGYYARARNLRRAAVRIARDHGGVFPRDLPALSRLPGFGEYTAAAVACLAFGSRHPAADANVTRVLSRLFAIGGTAGTKKNRAAVLQHAGKLLASGPPGALTATLMDLGQLVCTSRRPLCVSCPLAENCLALRKGSPERFPRRARKPPAVPVFVAAACARQNGRALLVRRSATLLDRLWEFPSADAKTRATARRHLIEKLAVLGLSLDGRRLGSARHTVVNRRLTIEVFPASLNRESSIFDLQSSASRWFTPRELARAAIPTLTRKVAHAAGFLPSLAADSRDSRSSGLAPDRGHREFSEASVTTLAAREVSRSNQGRRRAPRERSAERGTRLAVEAASGRAASRCASRRRSHASRGATVSR